MNVLGTDAMMNRFSHLFSGTYAEARVKFLDAAAERGAHVESFEMDQHRGALGEVLAIDVVRVGPPHATRLLIISSGTHGPEGFCGSGCQVATLHDDELLKRIADAGLGLLLIHAVNPYGFSHLRRTNEDNIDLNRNHVDFNQALPANVGYAALEPLLLPRSWPPTSADEAALAAYVRTHGERAFRATVSEGQYVKSDGMFYGGEAPSWSNRIVRSVLRRQASSACHIGWIDVHTGLGPHGHGEKIYPGRPQDLSRARAWWGADVFAPFEGNAVSPDVRGPVVTTAYDECPGATTTLVALEFGTLPLDDVLSRLRADHWLRRHPEASESERRAIRRDLRDAFYCDNDAWKAMTLAQTRVALLQAVQGLRDA